MRPRIKDVAARAGVSTATVSRVLAEKPPISDDARRRVERAVAELGYRPNRVARSLRTQRSRIIGVVIPDIQNPFFIGVVRAIQDVAYARGHAVFLCNTDENQEKERLCVDLLHAERVAGVIVAPVREHDAPCRLLAESGIPMVVLDRRLADAEVDTVLVDNVAGARAVVSHLIADGHHRIGAVLGNAVVTTGRERREGYVQALVDHALPVLPELARTGPSDEANREDVGYARTIELLELSEPPTALFTGTNLLTVGALRAIHERERHIPEDIALAAFDEIEWMSLVRPALTVVAQPMHELGRQAVDLLLRRIDDPNRPHREVMLQPTVVIRHSCAHHLVSDMARLGLAPVSDSGA